MFSQGNIVALVLDFSNELEVDMHTNLSVFVKATMKTIKIFIIKWLAEVQLELTISNIYFLTRISRPSEFLLEEIIYSTKYLLSDINLSMIKTMAK